MDPGSFWRDSTSAGPDYDYDDCGNDYTYGDRGSDTFITFGINDMYR